ncbi:MAG: polysaccharide biosynthesis protein [Phycisphaerales bacterium]|nr:polysaccharide biosynthesis protein [Phycisphaerales bacterium]
MARLRRSAVSARELARGRASFLAEAAWLGGGFAIKLPIQLGTLYVLTRGLGAAGVGTFFALVGLFACVAAFVQLGTYDLVIRDVARGEPAREVVGRAFVLMTASFACLLPLLLAAKPLVAGGVGWPAYVAVTLTEAYGVRLTVVANALAIARRATHVCAAGDVLLTGGRLAAVWAATALAPGVDAVLVAYAAASAVVTAVMVGWVVRRAGRPVLRTAGALREVGEHARMVAAWSMEMLAREGDKPILAALSDPRQAGIYGTATRLFLIALVPIDLLSTVFRQRAGRASADPVGGARVRRQMAVSFAACGAAAAGGLVALAWLLPRVAPERIRAEFADAQTALLYLAVAAPIYGLQRANVISAIARGATGAYAKATAAAAVIAVATLAAAAPAHGWRAACAALVAYLSVSCLLTWVLAPIRLSGDVPADEAEADPVEVAAIADLQVAR